jgi:hypothetical protein
MASFSTGTALTIWASAASRWAGAEELDGAVVDDRDQKHEGAHRKRTPCKTGARQNEKDERAERL